MSQMIIDRRGKAMAKGGRHQLAQRTRHLRAIHLGNASARHLIISAKLAYAAEAGPFDDWTAGQQRHNRWVPLR